MHGRAPNRLGEDGHWSVQTTTSAPYRTRVLVRRPKDPARFNGVVEMEWLNVSGGLDAAPDWGLGNAELLRGGFAWVGVSAQAVALNRLKDDPRQLPPVRTTAGTTGSGRSPAPRTSTRTACTRSPASRNRRWR